MTGLIWFVQLVHYPLFARLGPDAPAARDYQHHHMQRTSRLVLPVMLTEALAALSLLLFPPPGVPRLWTALGAGMLAAIWLSTFALQVPLHERLRTADPAQRPALVRALVRSNWPRTLLWTARAVLALLILAPTPGTRA